MQATQFTVDSLAHAVGGAIDGTVEVGACFFDHNAGPPRQAHMDLALLVFSAAWTIDVGHAHQDPLYLLEVRASEEGKTPFDVSPDGFGECEVARLDDKLHAISPLLLPLVGVS